MVTRSEFAKELAGLTLSHADRAIAFLYYYRETQQFEERTASSLASDLFEEGFPKPNVTHLKASLAKSKHTLKGKQEGSFKLDLRKVPELEKDYGSYLKTKKVAVGNALIPPEWVTGTRVYLEKMVYQINGSYEYAFFDACAALCRRLMESLIIEVYIYEKRQHEIQQNGVFISLEKLIKYITGDSNLTLGRNSSQTMSDIKQLGDTAAHDRTYITPQIDIDDLKARYRRLIKELLDKAGIQGTT
jgi:hypothetical protein